MPRKSKPKAYANQGLITRSGIFPTTEREIALLMQEDEAGKRERAEICLRIAVHSIATVKAHLSVARKPEMVPVADDLRATFAEMINGSRYRAAWDLGDAPPMRIMASVAQAAANELFAICDTVPREQLERDAALLLLEVEQRHGVTHLAVPDPRQQNLL